MSGKKRGIFFSLDALLALFIVLSLIGFISLLSLDPISAELNAISLRTQAEDAVDVLAKTHVSDVRHEPIIEQLYSEGILEEKHANKTLLDVIGTLWATNNTQNITYAGNVSQLLSPLFRGNMNWAFMIGNDVLYNSSPMESRFMTGVSRRIVSGYTLSEPVVGYVSRAFLANIRSKETASYIFYGGLVSQGELKTYIRDIPANATMAEIYLEFNLGDDFDFYINGDYCGSFLRSGGPFAVNSWTITDATCLDSLAGGADNEFIMDFMGGNMSNQYVGGGFIRVKYQTDQFSTPISGTTRYWYPGIDGSANLYDSLYVPGTITSMNARFHIDTTGPIFFTLGNVTIYNISGAGGTFDMFVPDANISAALQARGVDYLQLSQRVVPLRVGHYAMNTSSDTGNSDTVLTTERAHSMGEIDMDDAPGMTRLEVAIELDKIFVNDILENMENRVGLISFHENVPGGSSWTTDLTNDNETLINWIENYGAGATPHICYTCPIIAGRDMLMDQSNETRIRAIVLMSDGYADRCDYHPTCQTNDEALQKQRAKAEAIYQACNTYQNTSYNYDNTNFIKIYTIGFGKSADNETLKAIANCTNATFFSSNNFTELKEIYKNISAQIKKEIYYSRQIVYTTNVNSTLYPDSYLEITFNPNVTQLGYKQISLKMEAGPFSSCTGSFFVPSVFNVTEASATSYSGDYWTDLLRVKSAETGGSFVDAFRLDYFGQNYTILGDPFNLPFMPSLIGKDSLTEVDIRMGASPTQQNPDCSADNKVFYTTAFSSSVGYGAVFPATIGRNVTVYYDTDHDGVSDGFSYVSYGENTPGFNPAPVLVSELDPSTYALDDAFIRLLDVLNFITSPGSAGRSGTSTNPIDIEIAGSVGIQTSSTSEVPYMWGPAEMGVVVWK
ncbi:MAG: VWA domain-containing protein [Candidatus Burarchaeum sp.]|nr:VWA domain-containing protein [Candidatus Burarchaeum sp.]MDO8339216.1 VWA domain-containing protein [Candidatus Burarchaeum sp.]